MDGKFWRIKVISGRERDSKLREEREERVKVFNREMKGLKMERVEIVEEESGKNIKRDKNRGNIRESGEAGNKESKTDRMNRRNLAWLTEEKERERRRGNIIIVGLKEEKLYTKEDIEQWTKEQIKTDQNLKSMEGKNKD